MNEPYEEYFRKFISILERDIQLKRFHLVFPQAKFLVELWKQLSRAENFSENIQSDFCLWVSKTLVPTLKKIDNLAKNEEVRIALYSFLHTLKNEILPERLSIHPKDLNTKHLHCFSGEWVIEGQITSQRDVVADLFQQSYAHEIKEEMQSPKIHYTDHQRISILLNFSLLHLSKCLFLANTDNEKLLTEWTNTVEQLVSWRLNQPEKIEDYEWNNVLRYYAVTWSFQGKVFANYTIDSMKTIYVTSIIAGKEIKSAQYVHKESHEIQAEKQKALDKLFTILSSKQSKVLKIQSLALFCERLNKGFKDCLFTTGILEKLLIFLNNPEAELGIIPPEFQGHKQLLQESRIFFKNDILKIFEQQEKSSERTRFLLNYLFDNCIKLLGPPPCQLGLLLLGSTSRNDRLPFSDVELALLYKADKAENLAEAYHYISALIALMEIQIIHLGESSIQFQGFWLDGTTSLREHEHLRSDVNGMIQKGIREKETYTPMKELRNPRNLKLHSLLCDPSAYSLVQPTLVNAEYGGSELFEDYQKALKIYLDESPSQTLSKEFFDLLYPEKLKSVEVPQHLTKRKMIALWVWWDILRCLPDHVDLTTGEIDLKKALHKPIAYFLMSLRLYYELPAKNLEEILRQAKNDERKLIPSYISQFLIQILDWEIQLRARIHLKSEKQNETISLSELSPIEQKRIEYTLLIFNLMEKAMSHYLRSLAKTQGGFKLENILSEYFKKGSANFKNEEEINKEEIQTWFLEVTTYLLYTRAPLEVHRYYYRQIPEKYRQECLNKVEIYFFGEKDIHYWETDDFFWERLWDAPLCTGERKSHTIKKAEWSHKINKMLLSSKEAISKSKSFRVYLHGIKSNSEGECGLKPAIVKELFEKEWITTEGKFVLKEKHEIAERMPGNHLVIPWPLPDEKQVKAILAQPKQKGEENKDFNKRVNAQLLMAIQSKAQFYIKIYPENPLVELFLIELTYRLCHYPPREADVWLWECEGHSYPIIVSEAVSGKTFQEVLENNSSLKLNLHAFSESVLLSGLVSLEDNKADNLILTQTEKEQKLYLIDGDRWFALPFKNNKLHAKNVIFCLSQMSSKVDPLFREEILSLNPEALLQSWANDMKEIGKKCSIIFKGKINLYFYREDLYSFQCNDTRRTLLLPSLHFHAVIELFNHLKEIKKLLESPIGKNITLSQLLSGINTRLANHYNLAREIYEKPLDCFKHLAKHEYLRGKNLQQEYYTSRTGNFLTERQDMYGKKETEREKIDIVQNWMQDIEMVKHEVDRLNQEEEIIKFARTKILENNFSAFLKLSSNGKYKILSEFNWSEFDTKKQRVFLNYLLNPGEWFSIKVINSEEIKDDDLQLLIQKNHFLKNLKLINCPNLQFNFWDHIPKYDWSIKNIFLENLENIHYFGYTASLFEKCIELPNLEILHIKECIFLEEVYINAPLLKETHLRNIPKLRVLHTKSSMLENLYLTGNIGLSLLSENHKIMNDKHIENLNILKWETQDNQMKPAENLFNQFPILLFMNFQNIDNKIVLKCIYHLCQLFGIKKFEYLEITHASRRKIKTDTEELFKHLVFLEEIKSKIINALIKTVDDSDSNISKNTISLDSPVVCPTVSEIQTEIANFSIQGYAQKKETLKFFSRLMDFPEHPSYSIVQIKLLEIALTNTDLYLRVDALKYYRGSIKLKIFQKLLNDSAWQIRKIAVKHLAASMIPDLPDIKERCELMIARLVDIDADVREEIARLLCQPKHRYAIDMIDDFLKAQTKEFSLILEIYIHIIWMMLGKSSQDHVQFLLTKGITHPDWQVQALTAESLGYAKHELTEVIKTMELLLTHEREYVQSKAKLGLKKLHQWATEQIKKELDDYSIKLLEKKPIILHNIPEGAYKKTLLFFPSNINKVSQIDSTETESLQIGLELPRAEINFLQ